MKRTLVTTTILAFALSTAAPLFAAEMGTAQKTPAQIEQMCKSSAKKEHIAKSKREAYVKSCVEKHTAKAPATAPAKIPTGE
jgi:hypothetical protein